jgi:putative cardiolipin synthase
MLRATFSTPERDIAPGDRLVAKVTRIRPKDSHVSRKSSTRSFKQRPAAHKRRAECARLSGRPTQGRRKRELLRVAEAIAKEPFDIVDQPIGASQHETASSRQALNIVQTRCTNENLERDDSALLSSRSRAQLSAAFRANAFCNACFVALAIALSACSTLPQEATLPLGAHIERPESTALANPEQTKLGKLLEPRARAHQGMAGFRLFANGVACFRARTEMAALAEKTLDVQYFSIESDQTGRLFIESLLDAADRGVRVRILVDDSKNVGRDAEIVALAGHPNIELRVFNPFSYRGALEFMRAAEFALNERRLNYRMHNKLFVVDNELALIGGRNIGDSYFAASETREFGDYDMLVAGPMVRTLSGSFDAFWNSPLAIPLQNLVVLKPTKEKLDAYRETLRAHHAKMEGSVYTRPMSDGGPIANVLGEKSPLIWARAEAIYDSPEKAKVESGKQAGQLLRERVEAAAADVKSELIVVTPYLVPGDDGMRLFTDLRSRKVRVRILTNSLQSTDAPITFSAYGRYRVPMLEAGIELYETRPELGNTNVPGGGSLKSSSATPFALHAKVFVFDRRKAFVGSMNFDERSRHLNTELGVLVESPEIAKEIVERFDAVAQPANSYVLALGSRDATGKPKPQWRTEENGAPVVYEDEPRVDPMVRLKVQMLSLLPLDSQL